MKNEANIDSLLLGETCSRFCSLKQQLFLFFILNQGKAQQRGFISASLLCNTAILAGVGREVMSVLVLAAFLAQPERPSSQCDGGSFPGGHLGERMASPLPQSHNQPN